MDRVSVTVSDPFDANLLVTDVRPADRIEWVLCSGARILPMLRASIEQSSGTARTAWLGDAPLCIWGVSPQGCVWLVGTNTGQRHALRVQRHFRERIAELHEAHPVLDAWAYEENHLHHYWMERMGFERTGDSRVIGLGARVLHFRRLKEIP